MGTMIFKTVTRVVFEVSFVHFSVASMKYSNHLKNQNSLWLSVGFRSVSIHASWEAGKFCQNAQNAMPASNCIFRVTGAPLLMFLRW
jgi:hypothetical protein